MMASGQRPQSAEDWTARLRSDRSTAEDRAGYEKWLEEDPANREAAQRLDQVWQSMGELEADPLVQSVLQAPARPSGFWRGLPLVRLGSAALVCLAIAVASLLLWQILGASESYQTANGEQRVVDLGDGSRLHLNVSTRLEVSLKDRVRRVQLERGQAFFDVAPDPSRPFIVTAGDKEITVLGTKFDVLVRGEDTRVTVIEGRVAVTSLAPGQPAAPSRKEAEESDGAGAQGESPPSQPVDEPIRLELTDREAISWPLKARPSSVPSSEAMSAIEAWRSGRVVFDSTPLREAVAELDRYTPVSLRLGSAELGSTEVSGVFYIDRLADVESLIFALENSLPIHVERRGDELLLQKSG
ncbi:MAG: FecR domain-containing protein [Acidobacteriota bacterium]